jgi:hypothetical protein
MAEVLREYAVEVFVAILAAPIILLITVSHFANKRRERRESAARAESNRLEAEAFFNRVAAQGLEPVETDLILGADEHAVLFDVATLYETRSHRVYAGAGTSIKGLHVGGGASQTQDSLRRIEAGVLILTTARLVFDGTTENRTIKLRDILSVSPMLDAIEVSTQRRQKSMLFSVPNPQIWAPMIKNVASSKVGGD